MFKNYELYLAFLNEKLHGFFEKQKEYIKCQKGCAKCCKGAEYPFSLLEFQYLLQGFCNLDKETQNVIDRKIDKIIQEKKAYKGEKFSYDCPFLIDDACSVYNNRGIVCRAFGLLVPDDKDTENTKIPFCYKYGLNYANVYDEERNTLSTKKFEEGGYKIPPLGFNVSHTSLTNHYFEDAFNIKFGKKQTLINWLIEFGEEEN